MKDKISKANLDLEFLNSRLDEVRMSAHERLLAKASLARADAISDSLLELTGALKRLLKNFLVCPIRRLTSAWG